MHLSDVFEIHNLRVSSLNAEAETGFGCRWSFVGDSQVKGSERSQEGQSISLVNREP